MSLWGDPSGMPVENLLRRGHERHQRGELEGAIEDFSAALDRTPHMMWLWLSRGLARYQQGDPDRAIPDFDRALHLDPQSYEAHEGRAWARYLAEDFTGALADHAWMVEHRSSAADAYAWRSPLHVHVGNFPRAMDDATFAIELDPRNSAGYLARARVFIAQNGFAEALADLERAVALKPADAFAHTLRGHVHVHLEAPDRAVADYTKAIELDRRYGWAYYGRAAASYCRGDWTYALSDFEQASTLALFDPELRDYARLRLWMTQTRAGRGGQASEPWSRYLQGRPRRKGRDWHAQLGNFLLGLIGEQDFARGNEHPNARHSAGRACQGHFHVGINRLFRGDRRGAAWAFEQCLATDMREYYEFDLARAELAALKR
jgi:tetratricopeptide (TPR) repeat protein